MFRDDTFSSSGGFASTENNMPGSPIHAPNPHANTFDDIFGSAPSSPTATGLAFSDLNSVETEPSDISRLRSQHSTAGYRDGLTASKATTLQEGFDEGYSLGAEFGLEIGEILGVLQGIYAAAKKTSHSEADHELLAKTKELLGQASRELELGMVFDKGYWDGEGIWTYEVERDGDGEVTFREVVASHPLVMKWRCVVEEEAKRWGLDLKALESEDAKRIEDDD
jgi:hypothetical protein